MVVEVEVEVSAGSHPGREPSPRERKVQQFTTTFRVGNKQKTFELFEKLVEFLC